MLSAATVVFSVVLMQCVVRLPVAHTADGSLLCNAGVESDGALRH